MALNPGSCANHGATGARSQEPVLLAEGRQGPPRDLAGLGSSWEVQ